MVQAAIDHIGLDVRVEGDEVNSIQDGALSTQVREFFGERGNQRASLVLGCVQDQIEPVKVDFYPNGRGLTDSQVIGVYLNPQACIALEYIGHVLVEGPEFPDGLVVSKK